MAGYRFCSSANVCAVVDLSLCSLKSCTEVVLYTTYFGLSRLRAMWGFKNFERSFAFP
ncbi:unnamed protein product [Acanthoscelides obtectus]|uniref:Uncharacterized protein n=1 Tax=Acanthoscelides obtectus TaxID=200917 RepID=A0A9P0LVJ2_ACAOB|nr:unnamed protein product [Acanthoscelides obtectus]CAK1651298.1 hypothetical protein AOBTE_LOCUS17163 [Acanthoscelides obtectus]